jgi:outer membrane receptor protein involved in Fe transport
MALSNILNHIQDWSGEIPFHDDVSVIALEFLPQRPRHQGSITGEATLARGTLAATLISVGRRADSDFLGIGLFENAGFTRLDVRGAVRLSPHARVLATVENANDARYQDVLGYFGLPRRFRISIALDSAK